MHARLMPVRGSTPVHVGKSPPVATCCSAVIELETLERNVFCLYHLFLWSLGVGPEQRAQAQGSLHALVHILAGCVVGPHITKLAVSGEMGPSIRVWCVTIPYQILPLIFHLQKLHLPCVSLPWSGACEGCCCCYRT